MSTDMKDGMSRRQFVKTSAAAAAVPLVASRLAPGAYVGGNERLTIGLIGCGGRGTGAAVDALAADKGNVLWAMADAFTDRLENSLTNVTGAMKEMESPEQVEVTEDRKFYGFDAYQRVIELCDVILMVTPPHFRPMHIAAAVEAGKHVFAEKPFGVDAWGVRSVLESARKADEKGLCLMSGFCWRHSFPTQAAVEQIHGGTIGQIRAVQSAYNTGPIWSRKRERDWTDMEYQMRNWPYYTWLSGDHIVEQAIHNLDKTQWYFNQRVPDRCFAVGGRQCRPDGTGHIYDHFAVTYEYADGARAYHMCRQIKGCASDNTDYVMGEKGCCFINSWDGNQIWIKGETDWKCDAPGNNMYRQEHKELFEAIRGGRTINDGQWAAHSTLMAVMGRMAAYTGQIVSWEAALNSKERLGPTEYDWNTSLEEPPVAMPGQTKLI